MLWLEVEEVISCSTCNRRVATLILILVSRGVMDPCLGRSEVAVQKRFCITYATAEEPKLLSLIDCDNKIIASRT